MSRELQTLMDAIKAITKKEDKSFTMAITMYMKAKKIDAHIGDTINVVPEKFGLNIKQQSRIVIDAYAATVKGNSIIDEIDFVYYLCYIVICFLENKKIPITIPIKIGEINVYKNALLKEILV
jgi:hypothetical protein